VILQQDLVLIELLKILSHWKSVG